MGGQGFDLGCKLGLLVIQSAVGLIRAHGTPGPPPPPGPPAGYFRDPSSLLALLPEVCEQWCWAVVLGQPVQDFSPNLHSSHSTPCVTQHWN